MRKANDGELGRPLLEIADAGPPPARYADERIGMSRPASPSERTDTHEARISFKSSAAPGQGGRETNTRLTWRFRHQELAREYVDDESRDGCTSCPPTCENVTTFMKHMFRAVFPFVYLLELAGRWGARKCIKNCSQENSCCNRVCVPCCIDYCSCTRNKAMCCIRDRGGCCDCRRTDSGTFDDLGVDASDRCRLLPCYHDISQAPSGEPIGPIVKARRVHCCQRCCIPRERGQKMGPNQKLVTFRRMAECLGWLYYLTLVYVVLCHSRHFHTLVRDMENSFGIQDAGLSERLTREWKFSFSRMLFGLDPGEENMPDSTAVGSFVDPALSVIYYPVFAFLLLVILHAHEETSYPRRQRIEYSVETDSILSFGVKLISMVANDPDRPQGDLSSWKEIRNAGVTFVGALFALVGVEVLTLYYYNAAWLLAWENHSCPAAVPWVGAVLSLVAPLGWYCTGRRTQSAGFEQSDLEPEPEQEPEQEPEPEPEALAGEAFTSPRQRDHEAVTTSAALCRVAGRALFASAFFIGLQTLSFGLTCVNSAASDGSKASEFVNEEQAWEFVNENGLIFPVYAAVALLAGVLMLTLAHSDLLRKNGRRYEKELGKGDRVEIGAQVVRYSGEVGTVIGIPWDRSKPDTEMKQFDELQNLPTKSPGVPTSDHRGAKLKDCNCPGGRVNCEGACHGIIREGSAQYFKVPRDYCVVQLDVGKTDKLEQMLDDTERHGGMRTILVKQADIADVDWATTFRDTFADITGGELRKLSFESEKYSERYIRRFAELQCTPIENYHLQSFDSRSLDQLKEKFHLIQDKQRKLSVRTAIISAILASAPVKNWADGSKRQSNTRRTTILDPFLTGSEEIDSDASARNSEETKLMAVESNLRQLDGDDEMLLLVAEQADVVQLKRVLRVHVEGGDKVTSGPFFQEFQGSLIFPGREAAARRTCAGTVACCRSRCSDGCARRFQQALDASLTPIAGQGAVCGAALGALVGDQDSSGSWPWIGLVLGYVVGMIIGLVEADKDPTANHLANHILKLQRTMFHETETDAKTLTSPPMFADRVGKMILFLSKARQYKRRVEWRARLWYISIAHAAIPFIFTFCTTLPVFALYTSLYATVAGVVFAVLRDRGRRQSNEMPEDQLGAYLQSFAAKLCIFVIQIIPVVVVVAGLPGARIAVSGILGIQRLPGASDAAGRLHSGTYDVCGKILDTQGECCCSSTQDIVDLVVSDTTQCKFSQFFPSKDQQCSEAACTGRAVTPLTPTEVTEWNTLKDVTEYGKMGGYKGNCSKYLGNQKGHRCSLPCGDGTAEYLACRPKEKDLSGCQPGSGDGGSSMLPGQFCTKWCSESHCGDGDMYKKGTNCETCTNRNLGNYSILDGGNEKCRADFNDKGARSEFGCIGIQDDPAHSCGAANPNSDICITQRFLDEQYEFANALIPRKISARDSSHDKPTILHWCNSTNPHARCVYQVSQRDETACQIPFWNPFRNVSDADALGCLACGGKLYNHLVTFWATVAFTFAVLSRLYRCYEDYFVQYQRMLYFIQLTPWSTMKHVYQDSISKAVRQKHEHWGLLPTFDLDCTANIVAWNKLRLFLQTYELRSSRRLQVSVVYLFGAWIAVCVYQAVKAWQRVGDEPLDIETVFVLSTTLMLACGISAILFTGKWINDITHIGFPHVLRVKQAELLEKSSHYLVEHDFWNGTYLHSQEAAHARACVHHKHQYPQPTTYFGSRIERAFSADRQNLSQLKVSELRKRAAAQGISQQKIDRAVNSDKPHLALINLVDNGQTAMDEELRRELEQVQYRTDLEAIALAKGVTPDDVDAAGDTVGDDGQPLEQDQVMQRLIELVVNAAKDKHILMHVEHRCDHPVYDKSDANFLDAVQQKVYQEKGEVNIESHLQSPADDETRTKSFSAKLWSKPNAQSAVRAIELAAPAPPKAMAWLSARSRAPSSQYDDTARVHCYRLLETFIHTVQDEYRVGSRSHWGAEDRRTKLWFIVMGQSTIKGFAAALVSGASPLLLHVIDKSGIFDT